MKWLFSRRHQRDASLRRDLFGSDTGYCVLQSFGSPAGASRPPYVAICSDPTRDTAFCNRLRSQRGQAARPTFIFVRIRHGILRSPTVWDPSRAARHAFIFVRIRHVFLISFSSETAKDPSSHFAAESRVNMIPQDDALFCDRFLFGCHPSLHRTARQRRILRVRRRYKGTVSRTEDHNNSGTVMRRINA